MNSQSVRRTVTPLALGLLLIALVVSPAVSRAAPLAQKGGSAPIPIVYGQTVTGTISNQLYEQAYVFDGQAGDAVTISMSAIDPALDSYLALYNAYPSQNTLVSDDDSGGNGNAVITLYQLPATGRYYIVATRYGRETGGTTGRYSLSIDLWNGPVGATGATAGLGLSSFECNGVAADTAALVTFEDVRPGFSYRVTVLGLNGFDPVIALFAQDGSGLCNDDSPEAAGSRVDVPGVGVISADSLTAQVLFNTSGAIGDIQMNIGGFGGSTGRFVAIFEGLAIAPSTELDAVTVTTAPTGGNDDVYVYMISQYASLDPYMTLPVRGITCDDVGSGGCAGVPAFTGGGISIRNGGSYVTGQYDAGIGVVADGMPLTFQFSSYNGSSAGNYAMVITGAAAAGGGTITTSGSGNAFDYSAAPTYGQVSLNAGFSPDPYTVSVTAGGPVDAAANLGSPCAGFAASSPDFRLNYTAGQYSLRMFFAASGDTTLIVNAPDGRWYCDDDSGGNLNPLVDFGSPLSGQYDIWVGSFGTSNLVGGTLTITETQLTPTSSGATTTTNMTGSAFDYSAAPTYGQVSLNAGFSPDPYTVSMTAGGPVDAAANLGSPCAGFAASSPDFRLNYTAGQYSLRMFFAASGDTTLIVNAPDGRWYCDDDSGGNLNPLVDFGSRPLSGQYDIWVGSFGTSNLVGGTLTITETQLMPATSGVTTTTTNTTTIGSGAFNYSAAPTYGQVALTSGFSPDPYRVPMTAGGPVNAASLGSPCSGFAASSPDYRLSYTAGQYFLRFFFAASGDTTLIINAPDGRWYCDDDSGNNLNPLVDFGSPLSGQYDIWVGTYGSSNLVSGTLTITETQSMP